MKKLLLFMNVLAALFIHMPIQTISVYDAIVSPEALIAAAVATTVGSAALNMPKGVLAGLAGTAVGSAIIAAPTQKQRVSWQKILAIITTIGSSAMFGAFGATYALLLDEYAAKVAVEKAASEASIHRLWRVQD